MSKDELTSMDLMTAKQKLLSKEITSIELTNAFIDKIQANKHLNAFITESFEAAREQARKADKQLQADQAGVLTGIPMAFKDLFCTKGIRTTAASGILDNFIPPYESTVTQKLLDAGAVCLGKTNMDEFAMGSATVTSHYGPTVNPWKAKDSEEDLVPGGSSGGSAAAVAGNLCIAATASDTGGSIRQPAAFTGTVGIKPTYGRCSRYGMIAFASSLDQAGVITKSVADAALLTEVICGYDPKDSTSSKIKVPAFSQLLNSNVKGLKVGIAKEYHMEGMPEETIQLWQKGIEILKARGAEIVDISLPLTAYGAAVYAAVASAECSTNLSRFDGVRYGFRAAGEFSSLDDMYTQTRTQGFGVEVKRRIITGAYVLNKENYERCFVNATKVRRMMAEDFKQAFTQVDVILTPTAPTVPFSIQEALNPAKEESISANNINDACAVPVNLAGLPGISVPAGISSNGLPIGLQVIANRFCEETMLNCALALEEDLAFKQVSANCKITR